MKNGFVTNPHRIFAPTATTLTSLGKRGLSPREVRLAESVGRRMAHINAHRQHDHAH